MKNNLTSRVESGVCYSEIQIIAGRSTQFRCSTQLCRALQKRTADKNRFPKINLLQ